MSILAVFRDPGPLRDRELSLKLTRCHPADPAMGYAPTYEFSMRLENRSRSVGQIHLRLGDSYLLTHYFGQIAFGVAEKSRGRGLAARSLKLLFGLARSHGIDPLWITCNPDNWASRKTCEHSGASLVEIVEVGDIGHQKCRYRIDL